MSAAPQRHLLRMADLSLAEVDTILDTAYRLSGGQPRPGDHRSDRPLVGTLFLTSSMRTRVGFAAAAHRIGGAAIPVTDLRFDEMMSGAETFEDALRVLTGMVDAVVVRAPGELSHERVAPNAVTPVINGGDTHEHPTQSLIDLASIETFAGPISTIHLGICGDLTMRSVRSNLELLRRRPPRRLTLSFPPGRAPAVPDELLSITNIVEPEDLSGMDVLLAPGLAPKTGADFIGPDERLRYAVAAGLLARLPVHGIVLSPMPVVDEISPAARADSRLKMYEQSDLGVWVRAAVLLWALRREG